MTNETILQNADGAPFTIRSPGAPLNVAAQPSQTEILLALMPAFLRITAAAASTIFTGSPLVQQVLVTAATLLEAGTAGAAQFQALTTHLESMVNVGRDPTPEEWATLKAHSDAAHLAIQASGEPIPA